MQRRANDGKCKLLANIAMLTLLYGAPCWDDAINTKEYRRIGMVSVQQKATLRRVEGISWLKSNLEEAKRGQV